jgi:two-component system, NarL family, nitrate/nitrite response regulator NarL
VTDPQSVRSPLGILIVDDHLVVRAALRLLIERQPGMGVVGEAGTQAEALEIAAREQPGIILLDLQLGDESGLDLIAGLLRVAGNSRILVLTGSKDECEHLRAVRLGAMGTISKESPPDMLIKAIERVHDGELWLNRRMAALLVSELRRPAQPPKPTAEAERISRLTAREREIVVLIGQGKKSWQIADALSLSEATIRHHVTSILSKLALADRLELVVFAYKNHLVA